MNQLYEEFTPFDLQVWKRREVFYYFSSIAPTGYSITIDLDITTMRNLLKKKKLKFFPAYLWLITKSVNQQTELKIAEKDGQLGYYNTLTPLYACFHPDNQTFSLMWTKFNDDFMIFYQSYMDNKMKYEQNHGLLSQINQTPPANCYTVSCIPWVSFKHFAVHSFDNKPYYFPSIESGKFYEDNGRIMMPLSITCHHATTDGYHINQLIETLEREIDLFERNI